jgi:hypothetical protein
MHFAVEWLATSDDKLRERVLDVWQNHLMPLVRSDFPDEETRRLFGRINKIVEEIEEKIRKKPGPYATLLRNGLKTPLEIARSTLDYRKARRLAILITELYFKIEAGVVDEYEEEVRQLAKACHRG